MLWHVELFVEFFLLIRILCHAYGRPRFEALIATDILIQAFQMFGQRAHWFGLGAHAWYAGVLISIPLMYFAMVEASDYRPVRHRNLLFWWISLMFACAWIRIFPYTNTALLLINVTFFVLWIADSFSKTRLR